MTIPPTIQRLTDTGVSLWLDDLSRSAIKDGSLAALIDTHGIVGVTTNPTIFAHALANGDAYRGTVATLAADGIDAATAVRRITTADVSAAADVFRPVFDRTGGVDGRVSIEVDPNAAHDTETTVRQAHELWHEVGRPNAMIKIPATAEGLPAITAAVAAGISVNVTLIFGLPRYREVINAYWAGLEQAHAAGIDVSTIHSVASFFVSRVDVEVNKRLDVVPNADRLRNTAAVANARLAYEVFEQSLTTERWRTLADWGANVQRPLWASTGVKDPALSDTTYVDQLAVANTVNTVPGKTLDAVYDHSAATGDAVTGTYDASRAQLDAIAEAGVDLADVSEVLEREGVQKFIDSWRELLETVTEALRKAA